MVRVRDDERKRIAQEIATMILKGTPVCEACARHNITRASLSLWRKGNKEIDQIIFAAKAGRSASRKRARACEETGLESTRRRRTVKYARKGLKRARFVVQTCRRCGHVWRSRKQTIRICPHYTCRTPYFTSLKSFSEQEKRMAHAKREEWDALFKKPQGGKRLA